MRRCFWMMSLAAVACIGLAHYVFGTLMCFAWPVAPGRLFSEIAANRIGSAASPWPLACHWRNEPPSSASADSAGLMGRTKENRGPVPEFSAHTRPPCELRIILQIARPSPPPERSGPPPYDVYS